MQIVSDLSGQNTPVLREYRIYGGAADIVQGALVEPGVSAGEEAVMGAAVLCSTTAPTAIIGVLAQLHDYSVVGDWTNTAVTTNKSAKGDIDIRPFAIIRAEVTTSTQLFTVAANAGAGATDVTLTTACAADDEIGGAYVYNATTDELRFVEDHSDTDKLEFSAHIGTTAWNSASTCVLVPPLFYGAVSGTGLTMDATCAKVLLKGDESGAWCTVLEQYIQTSDKKLSVLNPATHYTGTYADAKFFVDIVVRKHLLNS